VLALIADGFYVGLVQGQGDNSAPWRIAFVAGFIALLAITVILGAARSSARWAAVCLGFAAAGLVTLAVLAGFSIGILLVPSALLAIATAIAAIVRQPSRRPAAGQAIVGAILAWGILFAGFTLVTFAPPGCPSRLGHVEGSISDGRHVTTFTCENGRLVTWQRN
jgi:drug/metabolite transporter (DMT)-like permease